jgi:putative transposase
MVLHDCPNILLNSPWNYGLDPQLGADHAYASWLNEVEIWFNRITQRALRRGTSSSVKELVTKIDHYVKNSNRNAQPFVWTATADSIFAKVERLCERIYGTAH